MKIEKNTEENIKIKHYQKSKLFRKIFNLPKGDKFARDIVKVTTGKTDKQLIDAHGSYEQGLRARAFDLLEAI